MSIIKKLLVIALALSLMLCVCACGEEDNTKDESKADTSVVDTDNEGDEKSEAEDATAVIPESATAPESAGDASSSAVAEDDGLTDYTVYVVDTEGNPVPDVLVQLCGVSTGVCFAPTATDANGAVVFSKEEDAYKACIFTSNEYTEFNGETEITLVYTAE